MIVVDSLSCWNWAVGAEDAWQGFSFVLRRLCLSFNLHLLLHLLLVLHLLHLVPPHLHSCWLWSLCWRVWPDPTLPWHQLGHKRISMVGLWQTISRPISTFSKLFHCNPRYVLTEGLTRKCDRQRDIGKWRSGGSLLSDLVGKTIMANIDNYYEKLLLR